MLQALKSIGSGGIRTHASEETGALNQRLRPLGHATFLGRVLANASFKKSSKLQDQKDCKRLTLTS